MSPSQIERLERAVKHAEERGQTNTAHHQMLERLQPKPVKKSYKSKKSEEEVKESDEDGS